MPLLIKIVFLFALVLIQGNIISQNNHEVICKKDRVVIFPVIDQDVKIPFQARSLLETQMKNMINLNGLKAVEDVSYFIMKSKINALSHEITASKPYMHSVILDISFYIKDNYSGEIFEVISIEVEGEDKVEERAYIRAIGVVNPRSEHFKTFMESAKDKIINFYNTECEAVILTAQDLIEQNRNWEAVRVLNSIPNISGECFQLGMKYATDIGPVITKKPIKKEEKEDELDLDFEEIR